MINLLKTAGRGILISILLVLFCASFLAKHNELNFLYGLIEVLLIVILFIYFNFYLKVKLNAFFKAVLFFFFLSTLLNAFNESNLYSISQFSKYLPQFLLLLAYFGLIYHGIVRLKRFKFKEITNLYLMAVLLINIVLTIVFVSVIIGNVDEVLQEYIIYVYCLISITLGFTSFAAYNQDGLKESFLFTAMALSFIFSDTQYTLHHYFMSNIVFEISDLILTTFGIYFMFCFIYEKQLIAEGLEKERQRLLKLEKEKEILRGTAIRL